MKGNMPNKVLLLLASSGLNEADLEAFGDWCEHAGSHGLLTAVASVKDYQRKVAFNAFDVDTFVTERRYPPSRSPAEDIAVLLRRDSRLSAAEAAEFLVARLQKRRDISQDTLKSIPPLKKSSFDSWVTRLSRQVPYSVLLQEATLIRNDLTHRFGKADWPLKQSDL